MTPRTCRFVNDVRMTPTEGQQIPALVLLAYAERKPHLRVLSMRDRTVSPVPIALDRMDAAISALVPRETWFAVAGHAEVWAAEIPLEGEPTLIARSFDCVPALHPDRVWVTVRDRSGSEACEYRPVPERRIGPSHSGQRNASTLARLMASSSARSGKVHPIRTHP